MISVSKLSLAVVVLVLSLTGNSAVAAPQADSIPERPRTEFLLPETTVAMLQVPNFQEAVEKLKQTETGKIMMDEGVTPTIDSVWDMVKSAYDKRKDDVGLEFSDLTSLPGGEVTFTVIAPRRKKPEYMIIMDLNNDDGAMDRVMERGREILNENDLINEIEPNAAVNEDGFELESFNVDGRDISFFQHENTIVACTSENEINDLIERWMGREVKKTRPLSANRKFVTIMKRCAGTDDLDPEFCFFVDPIAVAKSSTQGNPSGRFAINMLPLLGLDTLSAIGGTVFLDEEDFESVMHGHLLLTNPRSGIFSMLAFKPTDDELEPFIPLEVANHSMVSVDAPKAYAEIAKIYDAFIEPGAFEKSIDKKVNQEFGLNLKENLIDTIDGRVSLFQWIEEPAVINSTKTGLVFRLKDTEAFERLLDGLMNKANQNRAEDDNGGDAPLAVEKRVYREITIYAEPQTRIDSRNERLNGRRTRNQDNQNAQDKDAVTKRGFGIEFETPQFAIFGDCLVVTLDSSNLMKTLIDRHLGEGETLVDGEGYDRIVTESQRLLNNELPIANFYSDPKRQFKWILELVKSSTAQKLDPGDSKFFKSVRDLQDRFAENPLPEFEQLENYLTPSGGFVTDDDTGLHMLFFSLKQDQE